MKGGMFMKIKKISKRLLNSPMKEINNKKTFRDVSQLIWSKNIKNTSTK